LGTKASGSHRSILRFILGVVLLYLLGASLADINRGEPDLTLEYGAVAFSVLGLFLLIRKWAGR